jgi:hypothetical protein
MHIAMRRFMVRFREYLPSMHDHALRAFIALPPSLGGLGLMTPNIDVIQHLSPQAKWCIKSIAEQSDFSPRCIALLRSVTSNPGAYEMISYAKDLLNQWEEYPSMIPGRLTYGEATEAYPRLPGEAYREWAQRLKVEGIYTLDDVKRFINRPFKFAELLIKKPSDWEKPFRDVPFRVRLDQFQTDVSETRTRIGVKDSYPEISEQDISLANVHSNIRDMVNLNEMTTIVEGPSLGRAYTDEEYFMLLDSPDAFKEASVYELLLRGSPTLQVSSRKL